MTSQVRLNITKEQVYRLSALATPDTEVTCEEALQYSAVALFVARAQAFDQRFRLSEQNLSSVINICRRLDGIALALELAAARLLSLGATELTHRLDERFRLLNTGSSAAPTRQQTLAAAFEWSHALLSAPAQAIYRRLCVFVGGFTLRELLAVVALNESIDEWGALDLLSDLVERSLVALDGSETPRYCLVESTRAFALEKLIAAGEAQMLHQSHLAHFLEQVDAGRKSYDTLVWPQQRDWLARNYGNVRAALEWSLMGRHDVVRGAMLAACLHMFWQETAQTNEADYWLTQAIKHWAELSRLTQARLLMAQGEQFAYRGQYEEAQAQLTESVALYSAIDEARDEWAGACIDLGAVRNFRNAFDSAIDLLEQAASAERSLGNMKAEGVALHNLAYSHFSLSRIQEAEALLRTAIEFARKMGDEPGLANRLSLLAECARESGRAELALRTGREALLIQRGLGPSPLLANGNLDPAHVTMSEALAIFSNIPHPGCLAQCVDNCAGLALANDRANDAALLLGFAQTWRASHKIARTPIRQTQAEVTTDAVRSALGGEAYARGFEQGTHMTLEQGLAVATSLVQRSDSKKRLPNPEAPRVPWRPVGLGSR